MGSSLARGRMTASAARVSVKFGGGLSSRAVSSGLTRRRMTAAQRACPARRVVSMTRAVSSSLTGRRMTAAQRASLSQTGSQLKSSWRPESFSESRAVGSGLTRRRMTAAQRACPARPAVLFSES